MTEVLIAVAILLVLMGALLGLGRHLRRQSQENLCRGTLQILVAAIEQYHDFHQSFPDPVAPNPLLMPIENLYQQLYSLPRSRAVCEQIQKSLTGDTDKNGRTEFLDPWGKPLDYRYLPGQTFPVIVSAGVDGVQGTGDDISSR